MASSHLLRDADEKRSDFFKHVIAVIQAQLVAHSIDPALAEQAAIASANNIAADFGGIVLTIPRDYHLGLAKRDVAIFEDWNGNNYSELARKYKLTERQIRRIVDTVRTVNKHLTEPQLF